LPKGITIVELPSAAPAGEKRMKVTLAALRFGFCTAMPLNWLVVDAADANTACEYVTEEKIGTAEANSDWLLDPRGIPRI